MTSDKIIVIDCGGKQAYYTAKKLRGESFYCEMLNLNASVDDILALKPKGLLLIGDDVDELRSKPFDIDYTMFHIPILALGDAAGRLAVTCGAGHEGIAAAEQAAFVQYKVPCRIFDGMRETDHYFHRIDVLTLPEDWKVLADSPEGYQIMVGDSERDIYAYQGYIEPNDPEGLEMLQSFAFTICGCERIASPNVLISDMIDEIRSTITGGVLLPVFQSIESAVTARILSKALGNRLKCVFIDTGLLRNGDADLIRHSYINEMALDLVEYDASDRILKVLEGITDPHEKRRVIRKEFESILTEQYLRVEDVERLALGTTYGDCLMHKEELIGFSLEGQLPLEPLSRMFTEDIRQLAESLNVPEGLRTRAPFTVCGLAVRCIGEVTRERLDLLRKAERIFHEEIANAGYTRKIAQAFVILTNMVSHGEHGMGYVCVLRALGSSNAGRASACRLPYDLMENAVLRITDEVRGISRVVYDITGRPTADLEWE